MLHKILARATKGDFFLKYKNYFDDWTFRRSSRQPTSRVDLVECLSLLRPNPCSTEMVRIGGDGDGAYIIPNDLEGIQACFSPGVSDKIGFECELADRFGIPSYMCDASIDAKRLTLSATHHHFSKVFLGITNDTSYTTLEEWMKSSEGFSPSKDYVLQIDIEGGEYVVINSTPQSCLKLFRIVAIELHNLDWLNDSRFANLHFRALLKKLREHFEIVHSHPNNAGGSTIINGIRIPNTLELAFYSKNRIKQNINPLSLNACSLDVLNDPLLPPLLPGFPQVNDLSVDSEV